MGTRVRRLLRCTALWSALGLLLLFAGCDSDRPEVSGDLMNAFGGVCSPAGLWTRNALKQNDSLVQTLQNLVSDPDCKDYLSSLMTVQSAVSQSNKLLKDDSFLKYRSDQEQIQDLSLALQSPSSLDPNLVSQLQSQLILTQLDLYQANAMERATQTVADKNRYAQSTADLSQYLQTVMTAEQSGGMAACLKKHPEAAVGMAGNLLALGGSFVSPIYGAGFAVVGQILSIGVDYASHSTTEDAIWNLHAAAMPTALTCGLESMTELFCDAEDSFALLELKRDSLHNGTGHTAPIWKGIDLLSNRMPVLNDWLTKVKNGIAPTDPGLANKQNQILDKMNAVDKTQNSVFASLSDDKQSYLSSPPEQKDNVMIKTIKDQINLITGSSGGMSSGTPAPNPFMDLTTDSRIYACWLVLGIESACPKPGDMEDPESYIRRALLTQATFDQLFSNWKKIYTAVKTQVDHEFARTITANPSSLIADAYESSPTNVSPRQVLQQLIDYFEGLKKTGGIDNPAYKPHLNETIALLQDVLSTLDPNGSDDPTAKIGSIYQKLELNRGLEIFADRISRIVEWDINAKIKNGEFPKDLTEILKLAGSQLNDRLIQSGQGETDSDLAKDLNDARSIAQANITVFRDFFGEAMGKSVEMLHKAAIEAGEPDRGPNRPNGQMLGHLCTLILSTGKDWPSGLDRSICEKAYLDPLYGEVGSPAFSIEVAKLAQEMEGKPFSTRFCAYHKYMRAERLAELPPVNGQKSVTGLGSLDWSSYDLLEMMLHP